MELSNKLMEAISDLEFVAWEHGYLRTSVALEFAREQHLMELKDRGKRCDDVFPDEGDNFLMISPLFFKSTED